MPSDHAPEPEPGPDPGPAAIEDRPHAVRIAERIWCIGRGDGAQSSHVYLLEQGDRSVLFDLFDPTAPADLDAALRLVGQIVPLAALRWLLIQDPDPGTVAALAVLGRHLPGAAVLTHPHTAALLGPHQPPLPIQTLEEAGWHLALADRGLDLVPLPHAGAPGAFASFDAVSGVLFSGALFGRGEPAADANGTSPTAPTAAAVVALRAYHQARMPSRQVLDHALAQIDRRPVTTIAPRHGPVIPPALVGGAIEALRGLDCGVDLIGPAQAGARRLCELDATLGGITETMLLHRDFRDIATRLLAVVQRSLPVAWIDYYAQLADGKVLTLTARARFAGIVEGAPPSVCSFVGRDRADWIDAHAVDPAFATHQVHDGRFCDQPKADGGRLITVPLSAPGSERVDAIALMHFSGPVTITSDIARVIAQLAEPLHVALEREVIYRHIDQERERAYQRSIRDPLTGLFTRFYMHDVMQRHFGLQDRDGGSPVSAIMVDLDHFKRVNDTHGHAAGDRVLTQVAALLGANCRSTDVPVRLGGEEMLVLLIDQRIDGAGRVAERLRRLIAAQVLEAGPGTPLHITASLGIAERLPREGLDSLLHRVDMALYEAKRLGRNRVEVAPAPPAPGPGN